MSKHLKHLNPVSWLVTLSDFHRICRPLDIIWLLAFAVITISKCFQVLPSVNAIHIGCNCLTLPHLQCTVLKDLFYCRVDIGRRACCDLSICVFKCLLAHKWILIHIGFDFSPLCQKISLRRRYLMKSLVGFLNFLPLSISQLMKRDNSPFHSPKWNQ